MKKRSLWAWMLLYSSVAARGSSLNLGVRLVKAQNLSEILTRRTHKTCVAQETGGNTRMRWDTEIERRVLR